MELLQERYKERTRHTELLKLKKKNTELATITKQLEDKVKSLEKVIESTYRILMFNMEKLGGEISCKITF